MHRCPVVTPIDRLQKKEICSNLQDHPTHRLVGKTQCNGLCTPFSVPCVGIDELWLVQVEEGKPQSQMSI